MLLINIIIVLVMAYFTWAVAYQFIFAVAASIKNRSITPISTVAKKDKKEHSFAVIIPAYKEDRVILETARQAINQQYAPDLFEVFVLADQLQPSTLETLKSLSVNVVEIKLEKSSKAKALNVALSQIDKNAFDIAVILDADNIMKPNFLERMNDNFNQGHQAVQGCRAAKNEDTSMAILDGASEAANNNILGAGPNALGLSGRLAGSGMAFDFELFREVMQEIDAISGFDKELELRLTKLGVFSQYDSSAIVYDEKVRNTKNYTTQRGRWLAAQYQHFSNFIGGACIDLVMKGNYDFFNKVIQMALPPRLLLPVFLGFMVVLNFVLSASPLFWLSLLIVNIATYFFALPISFWTKKNMDAFSFLPNALVATLRSLLLMQEAKKRFLHTVHG